MYYSIYYKKIKLLFFIELINNLLNLLLNCYEMCIKLLNKKIHKKLYTIKVFNLSKHS